MFWVWKNAIMVIDDFSITDLGLRDDVSMLHPNSRDCDIVQEIGRKASFVVLFGLDIVHKISYEQGSYSHVPDALIHGYSSCSVLHPKRVGEEEEEEDVTLYVMAVNDSKLMAMFEWPKTVLQDVSNMTQDSEFQGENSHWQGAVGSKDYNGFEKSTQRGREKGQRENQAKVGRRKGNVDYEKLKDLVEEEVFEEAVKG
ncbi:hypothetical protein RIF29_21274 [Crotalaria pallida]|uniref:Uncharacterized protein n=1 Tax=Crotalaria pallida TaxID=3830 RepID=A0AAN9F721_CROPI